MRQSILYALYKLTPKLSRFELAFVVCCVISDAPKKPFPIILPASAVTFCLVPLFRARQDTHVDTAFTWCEVNGVA